jgi:selenocysteine-specific elongation factor
LEQVNITIGTAGHIDHGKTALVKCLTGCDTDRLKEEKERGMSIELGFAPCKIADKQVGIVDVPGHENFIKTMVAGANGMDAVILVVAADDGVMPQTREHLDILTLLGVRHGIVALTKIDRVSPEHRADVQARLSAFLRGTFLEAAPILPLSNITGEGFNAFLEALWAMVGSITPRRVDGVFRVPLERAFSVQGYGTVIAGIPTSGSARIGDEVVLLPHNFTGRIRRIEVYGQDSDTVMAGQCAAINVGHWDHREIRRGDTLTVPGYFSPQEWFVCSVRLLPREKLRLKSGAEVKFHTGTSEVAAMFYPLHGSFMEGGDEGLMQVRTKTPVVAGPGDPFLIRTPSPVRTVGGGRIVEAVDRRFKASRANVSEDLEARAEAVLIDTDIVNEQRSAAKAAVPAGFAGSLAADRFIGNLGRNNEGRFVEYCIRTAESAAVGEPALAVRAKILPGRLPEICAKLVHDKTVFTVGARLYVHRDTAAELGRRMVEAVDAFHSQSPESPGLPIDQLRQSMPVDKPVFDAVVARLTGEKQLMERGQRLALPSHSSTFQDEDAQLLEAIETFYREKAFAPPSLDEVVQHTTAARPKVEKLLKVLHEHERLVRVDGGLMFHRDAVARAREIVLTHFGKESRLESVDFKYLLDTTRKFALPLLDHLDRIGVTRRVGNTRYLREAPRNTGA